MKIVSYEYPKSSFLSIDKDMRLIVDKMFENERLKKLLYYTTKDCLDKPNVTDEQMVEMMGKNIKNVPKLTVDGTVLNYISISFNNFTLNKTNPEFRDNVVEFDIICHFNQWNLTDFALRPYKIAAEIDSMFNNRHLTGIGTLQFIGANQVVLTDEYAGLCLMFAAIHGDEDKINAPTGKEDADLINNFNTIFNS